MNSPGERLSKVERRLLDELLAFRAALPLDPPGQPAQSPGPTGALRSRGRRIQNAVVATAILALLAVIVAHQIRGTDTTPAATPAPLAYHLPAHGGISGRQELLDLAAAAARQPAPPTAHPRYAYTLTQGWYLDTRVDGQATTSAVIPSTTEQWVAPNGWGHVRRVTRRPDGGRSVDDFTYRNGPPLQNLSTNATVLARQLAVGHPVSNGPVERFVALTDLAAQQPISPRVEAAILRLLARTPGLINQGSVIDRAGRPGVAVGLNSSYAGGPERYTWIFDRTTGALLGQEETLIRDPGGLHVRPGSVIAYTTFLSAGWTATPSGRPGGAS